MSDGSRTDAEAQPLCLRFTKTATARADATPREHLRSPADLGHWLAAAGLGPGAQRPSVDDALLREALELREAVYRAARSVTNGGPIAERDRRLINEWAGRNDAFRVLEDAGARYRFPGPAPARSALAVLAGDAVDTLGGVRPGTVKVCAGTGCVAVFLDTSRGRSRRWCSMGTCGNRAKKDAMRTRREQ